ncbi:hypothetical protein [Bosea sp. (in: a-proteobacteria)]|uniref:hypothetical protein n=1 Tax=Bosea sp. (in: a-proteobacteria) TaxID=1871050 RepID=UPI003B3A9DFE
MADAKEAFNRAMVTNDPANIRQHQRGWGAGDAGTRPHPGHECVDKTRQRKR